MILSMETPYGRTYWVKAGLFLAGAYPDAQDDAGRTQKLNALLSSGIKRFINLVEQDESPLSARRLWDYRHLLPGGTGMDRFPMPVGGVPDTEDMARLLCYIDNLIDHEIPVFVHSFSGRGRAGLVVGCWLMRHGPANPDTIVDRIADLRAHEATAPLCSPQTPVQIAFVRAWHKMMRQQ